MNDTHMRKYLPLSIPPERICRTLHDFCIAYRADSSADRFYAAEAIYSRVWRCEYTKDLRELKIRTDSLEQEVRYKDQYLESIRSGAAGKYDSEMDTTS